MACFGLDWATGIGRDEARELARRELSKPSYDREPPLLTRISRWLLDQLERIIDAAAGALPGAVAAAIVVAVLVVAAVAVVLRAGPLARRAGHGSGPVLPPQRRTAAEYLAAADLAAQESRWNDAVVERYRAVVAGLEERGILEARSGRTADEAAREAGAVLVGVAEALVAGATLFDSVRYGGHRAGPADDDTLRRLYDAAASAVSGRRTGNGGPALAVPR